jgi:hypothetical protein
MQDLSMWSNKIMELVQEELKKKDIWFAVPLRMSMQRDPASMCYYFILSDMRWSIIAKVAIFDETMVNNPASVAMQEITDSVVAALLLNIEAWGQRGKHA